MFAIAEEQHYGQSKENNRADDAARERALANTAFVAIGFSIDC